MNWEKARETQQRAVAVVTVIFATGWLWCCAFLGGAPTINSAARGAKGEKVAGLKGGGMNPKMENQILAQLICLSQLPKAGDEDNLTA